MVNHARQTRPRPTPSVPSAHIVIATVGSQGDLFPFLAVGVELRRRGHRVTLAGHPIHAAAVEQAGLAFHPASGMLEPEDKAAFMGRAFDRWRGPRFVVRDLAANDVAASYKALSPLCASADLLVTTTLAFAGQIIGERESAAGRLRWLSAVLAPAGFISAYDPPAVRVDALDRWLHASPARGRLLRRAAQTLTHGWTGPVRDWRGQLGLPPESPLGDPFHQGQFSPQGVLALFSPMLGAPQPDWPSPSRVCGFPRYAQAAGLPMALREFLDAGPAPLVFTLGSAAVYAGTDFLRESIATATRLNQRAVLLTGASQWHRPGRQELPPHILAVDYAPHAALFKRAAAIIHHGGVGTSSEALCAGLPMLVVPFGFDQPDNARRLRRLGVAEILPATRYRARPAVALLQRLQQLPAYARQARDCAASILQEDGAARAADLIEAALDSGEPPDQRWGWRSGSSKPDKPL